MAFVPSDSDRRKCSALLKLRSLSDSVYERYRRKADSWVEVVRFLAPPIVIHGQRLKVARVAFHRSHLFDREYVIASVSQEAMSSALPGLDASAATLTDPDLPPVVIVPDKSGPLSRTRLSILEHEIVHINQMLTGVSPQRPKTKGVPGRLNYFAQTMRMEYEANLLQLVRWPGLYPKHLGLSLDHWCTIRGFASALETTLRLAAADNLPPGQAVRLVQALDSEVRRGGLRLGIDEEYSAWFLNIWPQHLGSALARVVTNFPTIRSTMAFAAMAAWWRSRYYDEPSPEAVTATTPAEPTPARRRVPRSSHARSAPAR